MAPWSRLLGVTTALTLTVGMAAGCSSDNGGTTADGKIAVVASTNVWGSVAAAVGGEYAEVTALYTSPDGDPHEFEANAKDTAKVSDAGVVILNGGHYDAYMETAPKNSGAIVINAFDIMEGDEHGGGEQAGEEHSADEHSGDEDDHSHAPGAVNEHVFYNLTVVGQVADAVADALSEKDSANEQTFRDNAAAFNTQLDELHGQLAAIKAADPGAKVVQTEPLAGYLLTEAGLDDVTPAGLQDAVEAGQSPSARDVAATQELIRSKSVRALIYNTQAVDDGTKALLAIADAAGVPVVDFTETFPAGHEAEGGAGPSKNITDYVEWQRANVEALTSALAASATSTP